MEAVLTFSVFSCLLSEENDVCSFTDSATMSPATVLMKLGHDYSEDKLNI